MLPDVLLDVLSEVSGGDICSWASCWTMFVSFESCKFGVDAVEGVSSWLVAAWLMIFVQYQSPHNLRWALELSVASLGCRGCFFTSLMWPLSLIWVWFSHFTFHDVLLSLLSLWSQSVGGIVVVYPGTIYQREVLQVIASSDVWHRSVLMKVCVEFLL